MTWAYWRQFLLKSVIGEGLKKNEIVRQSTSLNCVMCENNCIAN